MTTLIRKRHEQCVLLLDDCFDSISAHRKITALGFDAERFAVHFPDKNNPNRKQQSVKDTRVIALCHERGFLLFTTDREMKKTHLAALQQFNNIAVVATATNTDGVDVWIDALGKSKSRILRDFKKCARPYFSILQKSGAVTTDEIDSSRTNRLVRAREKDKLTAPQQSA